MGYENNIDKHTKKIMLKYPKHQKYPAVVASSDRQPIMPIIWLFPFFVIILFSTSCKKFLDEKIRKTDIEPKTVNQLWTLLDNNESINGSDPYLLELVADNYFLTEADANSFLSTPEGQHYIWASDALPDATSWTSPYYFPIYYSNIVLDQLPKIKISSNEQDDYENIMGASLFYRAFSFYSLAQLYCKPYITSNLDSPGIVLKLNSDLTAKSTRASVGETYNQITGDLLTAADLLPDHTPYPTRPSKTAAYAMLARVNLAMRSYAEAWKYANMALQLYSDLIDYNTLDPSGYPPVPSFNPEVIYHNSTIGTAILSSSIALIDSNLYNSYDDNDLRKTIFFVDITGTGYYGFQGSYHGTFSPDAVFTGLTTGELYLIRAECFARNSNVNDALKDLNMLLKMRWSNASSYTDITATDPSNALNKILIERRKELVYRGQRWTDIRRLNLEGAGIELKRVIGSDFYTLPPNDKRSVMLIPFEEINKSGFAQNPR